MKFTFLYGVCCRVTSSFEDLFYGNLAPALPSPDPLEETLEGFCLCDGSEKCDREAVADTTADNTEPQRNVRLGVPQTPILKRRRKRQASSPGGGIPTGGNRTYPRDYQYELQYAK